MFCANHRESDHPWLCVTLGLCVSRYIASRICFVLFGPFLSRRSWLSSHRVPSCLCFSPRLFPKPHHDAVDRVRATRAPGEGLRGVKGEGQRYDGSALPLLRALLLLLLLYRKTEMFVAMTREYTKIPQLLM